MIWLAAEKLAMSKLCAQAEAGAHRRILRAGQAGSVMAGGPDKGALRLRNGEADGVADFAGGDFVIANQAGEYWQAGSVGGGPSRGA